MRVLPGQNSRALPFARALARAVVCAGLVLLLSPACSDDSGSSTDGGAQLDGGGNDDTGSGKTDTGGGGKTDTGGGGKTDTGGGGKLDAGAPPPPPLQTCTAPIKLDTSSPTTVVGTGTPASCTADALAAAVAKGGKVTFNCGAAAATIAISKTIEVPPTKDTIIDGGGKITLDGQGTVRILRAHNGNYRVNKRKLVLQRLTLRNGRAAGTKFTPKSSTNPKCAYGYADGAGGALRVRDMVLHVIDCTFINNRAASPGPDVGGGAIYALGAFEIIVVGSTFRGNEGSNGGAIGLLQTTGTFINTTFENNKATGVGANYVEPGCPGVGHKDQGGAGGNGGAISIDGGDDLDQTFCGVTFKNNQSNAYGGCVFRTANGQRRKASFQRALFDGNRAESGGGCLYISNCDFTLSRSLVANNVVTNGSGGGVRTERNTQANIVNTTFVGNSSPKGLMGALSHGGGGEIRNCTFANNKAEGGPTLFTAALGPAGPVKVYNTIFWNNATKEPYNPQACWFQPKAGANNLQWPRKRFGGKIDDTACVTNITWADARLGALADNGGPTQTMLPASGSPARGAGRNCPNVDQRGRPRNTATCAAGAVEP